MKRLACLLVAAFVGGVTALVAAPVPAVAAEEIAAEVGTATELTSTPNPSTPGQVVTFTATVTAPDGSVPIGTVSFGVGAASLCLDVPLSNGIATCSTALLPVAVFSVQAAYGGGTGHQPSSGQILQTVQSASTTTEISTSPNPSASGQAVTATVTVTSAVGVPSGEVAISGCGDVALDETGRATCTLPSLPAGETDIAAFYFGGDGFDSSSATTTQVVSTATRLVARPYASSGDLLLSLLGSDVSATLTAGDRPVAGQRVTFRTTAGPLCSGLTDDGGVARCQLGLLGSLGIVLGNGYVARFAGGPGLDPAVDTAPLVG